MEGINRYGYDKSILGLSPSPPREIQIFLHLIDFEVITCSS